jgi:hypothetical protein
MGPVPAMKYHLELWRQLWSDKQELNSILNIVQVQTATWPLIILSLSPQMDTL